MFKLIKITNSRINVPEFTRFPVKTNITYREGYLYYIVSGKPAASYSMTSDLLFIPTETVEAGSGQKFIMGYVVTDGMVFETDITGDATLVCAGDTISYASDDNGHKYAALAEFGEDVKLLNADSATTDGKVLVALKW